jgi:hypothetical protein
MRWAFLLLLLAGCDNRVTGFDAGQDSSGALDADTSDAGPVDAGTIDASSCPDDIRVPYSGPVPCSTTTRDCAAGCATVDCAQTCFTNDPNPTCLGCWDANQLACWNRNGCQPLWNCLSQCIQTHCSPDFTPQCIGANCSVEDQAYADCFEPLRMMCLERTFTCLPP